MYFCRNNRMKNKFIMYAAAACLLCSCGSQETQRFQTDYFGLDIDEKGYIVGMWNTTRESRNFSPADRPSPLLALYDSQLKRYYYPQKARFANGKYRLEYANGSIATVRLEEKDKYFKLTLEALDNREASVASSGETIIRTSTTCWATSSVWRATRRRP